MLLSRRSFLAFLGAAAAAGIVVPALDKLRQPYVSKADGTVSYIGRHPGGFMGSQVVQEVHPWDGHGFPVDLWNSAIGKHRALERYYDFDLANFRREIPRDFWHNGAHREFRNVHTWLRTQRFGESIEEAMAHLNFYGGGARGRG